MKYVGITCDDYGVEVLNSSVELFVVAPTTSLVEV